MHVPESTVRTMYSTAYHPKNVNSACISTVFEIQSGNFAGRLKTIPGQVVERLKILGVPREGAPYHTYNILTL